MTIRNVFCGLLLSALFLLPAAAQAQSFSSAAQFPLKKAGILQSRPARTLSAAAHSEQRFFEVHLRLSEMGEEGTLVPDSAATGVRLVEIQSFREGFEGRFPGRWQALEVPSNVSWKKLPEALRGSYCAGVQATAGQNSGPAASWLFSEPLQLSQVRQANLSFFYAVNSAPRNSFFFWGVSPNKDDFYGYAVFGKSRGWRFANLNFRQLPFLKKLPADAPLWLGFAVLTDADTAALDVRLDDVLLSQDRHWQSEVRAVVDGQTQMNFFSGGAGLARPAFVDIDADGDPDLFVGTYDGSLHFYRNDGTRLRPRWRLVAADYGAIDVGENSAPCFYDLDRDGDFDLLVGDARGQIHYFENRGTARWPLWHNLGRLRDSTGQVISVGSSATPAVTDLDDDAVPKMVIGNTEGYFALAAKETEISWRVITKAYLAVDVGYFSSPVFVDIDADGDVDLFTGIREKKIFFYENIGSQAKAHFKLRSREFQALECGDITAPAFADWDGDGDADLAVGNATGDVLLYENSGTPGGCEFLPQAQTLALQMLDVGFQCAPALADLDADGNLDLILGADSGKLLALENQADGGWKANSDWFANVTVKAWSTPAFADLDGDGDPDMVCGSKFGRVEMFRNTGSARQPVWQLEPDVFKSFKFKQQAIPALADIDADGDVDLFVGTASLGVRYIENVGTVRKPAWTLRDENFLNLREKIRPAPRFADLDGDGDLDMLVGTKDGVLIFYRNTGTRRKAQWSLAEKKFLNIDVRFFSVPAVGDIDADGDPDLFVGNNSGGLLFFRNVRGRTNLVSGDEDRIIRSDFASFAFSQFPCEMHDDSLIRYRLGRGQFVQISLLHPLSGAQQPLLHAYQEKGDHEIAWSSLQPKGERLKSGVYLLDFTFGTYRFSRKIAYLP